MPRSAEPADRACAVSAATLVLADRWCWLIVLEVAGGVQRFDDLVTELGISRKVLADRLRHLLDGGVLLKSPYGGRPPRHDYLLTERGRALLPVLVGLQDWGDRWVLGDGEVTATSSHGADADRIHALVGTRMPSVRLPATTGEGVIAGGEVTPSPTVLFTYPATGAPSPLPAGWSQVPGAAGCTLENRLFRDAYSRFRSAGVPVQGVSTQRPEEQRAFADLEQIPFPLLSDSDLALAAALRLPTVRVADTVRLRRAVLVIDARHTIAAVRYPVEDLPDAVAWALDTATALPTATMERTSS